nr:methyltransferase [uncultured Oscillibacter sp.]
MGEIDRLERFEKLVTDGIYRYSRNPAFLGFDLQYIGVLLMYCNLLTGMFTVFAMVMGCSSLRKG